MDVGSTGVRDPEKGPSCRSRSVGTLRPRPVGSDDWTDQRLTITCVDLFIDFSGLDSQDLRFLLFSVLDFQSGKRVLRPSYPVSRSLVNL